ncbi:ATP-binding protein [Massilia solisilvae]|uniref:histidine kinase n=1 Tax=Massilia solisilvae TaxID=1811225 RepID=A0ABT2BFI9_9BURK|nr:ATP-binding protein [Massilia solisilvae]MCS0607286.1 ATP-binding protein [Massilia solisilvae]
MRFSIGHRLFASVLLAILAVAVAGIALMRHNVMRSFSEYAVNIELDRLEELSHDLGSRYADRGGWRFVPQDRGAQRRWIGDELRRLQLRRDEPARPKPVRTPAPPPAPLAVATAGAGDAVLPPLPPPPAPPAPPVPPVSPVPSTSYAPLPEPPPDVDQLGLLDRVSLLDASGAYLAGRVPGAEPSARRAIEANGRTVGYLRVARVMRPGDALAAAFLDQLRSSLVAIAAASVALSALAAVLLAAHFRKPIRRLAAGAQQLAEGRFEMRLAADRSDELGELAHSFNQLAQRLEAMEASRRQWVADTSHELRTPLAVLRAQLEAIEDRVRVADPQTVAAMLRQVLALNKLIDQLYALARADVGALDVQRQPLDLWALACDSAEAFRARLEAAGLALAIGPAPGHALVSGDPDRLRQVFGNLLENALRYTASGGQVRLGAERTGRTLVITIEDSAPGVPDEALARLGERFYRVDASRSRAQGGAGLGLALCQRILQAHGATLAFDHSPLGGLRATLDFSLEGA